MKYTGCGYKNVLERKLQFLRFFFIKFHYEFFARSLVRDAYPKLTNLMKFCTPRPTQRWLELNYDVQFFCTLPVNNTQKIHMLSHSVTSIAYFGGLLDWCPCKRSCICVLLSTVFCLKMIKNRCVVDDVKSVIASSRQFDGSIWRLTVRQLFRC